MNETLEQSVSMVILGGPIKHWWDENWDTPEHWHYDAWREALSGGFVQDGSFLVYRPHHAFKGTWTERAQAVNDAAIRSSDAFVDMTPAGVPSEGTDSEKLQASSNGAIIVPAPPPEQKGDFDDAIGDLIQRMKAMGIHRKMVKQEPVVECVGWNQRREGMFTWLTEEYAGHVIRLHYIDIENGFQVKDLNHLEVDRQEAVAGFEDDSTIRIIDLPQILKAEVLERRVA